jgi:hypothetical protein
MLSLERTDDFTQRPAKARGVEDDNISEGSIRRRCGIVRATRCGGEHTHAEQGQNSGSRHRTFFEWENSCV